MSEICLIRLPPTAANARTITRLRQKILAHQTRLFIWQRSQLAHQPQLSTAHLLPYGKYPPSSTFQLLRLCRQRPETERSRKKAAEILASTARNVFVHYDAPVLVARRKALLESGTTKKKYPKTASQLWPTLEHNESFFWNEAAREIRLCMKKGILNAKGCLVHAGRLSERPAYIFHAEIAVASYLNLPRPSATEDNALDADQGEVVQSKAISNPVCLVQTIEDMQLGGDSKEPKTANDVVPEADQCGGQQLLDTLPDRFEYEQRMLYGSFAKYDYIEARKAEGKHQTAMLRQLANLFDKTGKVLFYYYVVPRLCKEIWPPSTGETVNSKAADIWRFLSGDEKQKWVAACLALKKQLGDGDVNGLETLQLDSLEQEVLRLHELAKSAMQLHQKKITND